MSKAEFARVKGGRPLTIDQALAEWSSRRRRMGCVSATRWFCQRVAGFEPLRVRRYLPGGTDDNGMFWEHVVATNGTVIIDLAPYADGPVMDENDEAASFTRIR